MKVFTVQDYMGLGPKGQQKVSDWLTKYKLEDVIMVTSQSILGEDTTNSEMFEESHVAVYADIMVKRYITESEFILISNSDTSPNAYTKVAEFFFDDFPWEVQTLEV